MLRSRSFAHPTFWALVCCAISAAPADAATTTTPASTLARAPASSGIVVGDNAAATGSAQMLWSNGSVSTTTTNAITAVSLRARGDQCAGAPKMQLAIDGKTYATTDVSWTSWSTTRIPLATELPAGSHTITVGYTNDYSVAGGCDRNLRLDSIAIESPAAPVQAESLSRSPSSAGVTLSDSSASGGAAQLLWANGAVTDSTKTPISSITVSARGDQCVGAPKLQLTVDGKAYPATAVTWSKWATTQLKFSSALPAGTHTVTAAYTNNDVGSATCDRNLHLDWIGADVAPSTVGTPAAVQTVAPPVAATPVPTVAPTPAPTPVATPVPTPVATPAPTPAPVSNPITGVTKLFSSPLSFATQTANALSLAGNAADAATISKIAAQPSALWLGGTTGDNGRIDSALSGAALNNSRVVFALYAIPDRDSGQYSAGGLAASTYRTWIDTLAAKVGSRPTIMILEPDAVAMPLSDPAAQAERYDLLRYAISKLSALPDTRVYLDAGNSSWWKASEIAPRLAAAGIAGADGFSLNVSNFQSTSTEVAYGRTLSSMVGGKPFVIDTSRNGAGPLPGATGVAAWCNPQGRALGTTPTLSTGLAGVDAFLWIKPPGETDGPCNGGPSQGYFTGYALALAHNAGW